MLVNSLGILFSFPEDNKIKGKLQNFNYEINLYDKIIKINLKLESKPEDIIYYELAIDNKNNLDIFCIINFKNNSNISNHFNFKIKNMK